jgi:dihydroorotase
MKKILIQSATILHPDSVFNGKKTNILVDNGIISGVDGNLVADEETEVIDGEGKFISPGFFDLNANFGEPGYETAEDLKSGSDAAAYGGFTGVAVHPNTQPPVDSKAGISYTISKTKGSLVDLFPLGCISQKQEGKDLAELYDMKQAGAVAFTDGTHAVTDSGLMSRALLYAKGINALIFSYPEDVAIAGKGKMNEGVMSTLLGMKGIPSLAEELMIVRDLYLAEYNESKIHFSTISTEHSVELIREAKKQGLQVSCDVAAHHLVLSEQELEGFDSNYKVKPPLRTSKDIAALHEGIKDGTIDAIVSQHTPFEVEFKNVEFEIAGFGIIGLQTVLPLLLKAGLKPEEIVEKLAINPRRILGLRAPGFEEGEVANFVLFDTEKEWIFDASSNRSKSANSPYLGQKLKGGIEVVVNNHKILELKY